jgi:hypothetical protein
MSYQESGTHQMYLVPHNALLMPNILIAGERLIQGVCVELFSDVEPKLALGES